MSRNPKAAQDDAEAESDDLVEAQAEMEERIDDELAMWDAAMAYAGHIPGLSSFGMEPDDYATYVGPTYPSNKKEQDMSCSKDDWQEFLKKIEEDLE
jgi:hypothetical protein